MKNHVLVPFTNHQALVSQYKLGLRINIKKTVATYPGNDLKYRNRRQGNYRLESYNLGVYWYTRVY